MLKHIKMHTKVIAYVPEEEYRKLRSKLALKRKTFSQWVREMMQLYLQDLEDKQ